LFGEEVSMRISAAAACLVVLLGGCQTTAVEPADEMKISTDEMREYLLSHSFNGTWTYSPEGLRGESQARFFERHGFLIASFKSTDRNGSWGEFKDNIAEVQGNTVSYYYGGPMRLTRTKDGLAGIQRFKNTYDVPYRLTSAGPAPRDPYALGEPGGIAADITTAAQLTVYLAEHSPFTGKWTWGEDRSGDASMTFRNGADGTLLVDLSTTRSNGERTHSRDNVGNASITDGRPTIEYTTDGVTLRGTITNDGGLNATRPFEDRYAISYRLTPR
jgi:hypothetical protein